MININDLSFKYKDKYIFKNLNLNIKDNSITTIIGLNGSGKTTLVKILTGLLKYDGSILIDDLEINEKNIYEIRKKIGIVFDNPKDQLIGNNIYDDLFLILKNIGYENVIDERIDEVANLLGIKSILNINYDELNNNQLQLANVAAALVINPKVLILDEAFNYIDNDIKNLIFEILKKLKEKMTIIIVTHNIEDTLISDEIVVLNNGIVLMGDKDKVYNEEKKLNDLGFKLPFIVELSNRLIFYGLIDRKIYDMEEMVNILWK